MSPHQAWGERLTDPESDGRRDGWKDGQTDAWRAGWRGGVVNGVRREALTGQMWGEGWVAVGGRWTEWGAMGGLKGCGGGRQGTDDKWGGRTQNRSMAPDCMDPQLPPPAPLTFPNQPLPISCR